MLLISLKFSSSAAPMYHVRARNSNYTLSLTKLYSQLLCYQYTGCHWKTIP